LAVAVTDNPKIVAPINETDNVIHLPWIDEAALEQAFADHGNEISSVIIEGIQGVGGIQVAPESFLQKIRSLCDKHNAVFIADGIQCGYGRTGKFYSHDFAGVNADIYTMAKGIGNGFPSVLSASRQKYSRLMVCWVLHLAVTIWLALRL
jgi:acetylornithine/N-succinyldiaminopimelate aminotransferase